MKGEQRSVFNEESESGPGNDIGITLTWATA